MVELPATTEVTRTQLSETEALVAIAEWNRSCYRNETPKAFNGRQEINCTDDSGRLLLYRCPACGRQYVDNTEGHAHFARIHTEDW